MTDFEKDVIDSLARIETKLDADFRAIHGNGKPGLLDDVAALKAHIAALEQNWRWAKWVAGVIGAAAGLAVSIIKHFF